MPGEISGKERIAFCRFHFFLPTSLSCECAKSRARYQFFSSGKDADPDIPILKEAKAEYAKLQ
jgi:hypothetical protein